jgi:ribonuclease D
VYPAARYQVHHFSIRVFFVQTPELRNQCLLFCRQSRSLSIDTETSPLNSKIDLLQIGDGNQVYLCPLRDQDPGFLNAVAEAIFQDARKTVYQFGSDDVTKFLRAIDKQMGIACTVVDVQERLRIQTGLQKGLPPGLAQVVQSRFGKNRILSKAWTNSGWDIIPLYQDQQEYAALDALFAFLLGSDMK